MAFIDFIASLFSNNFLVNLAFIIELVICLFLFSPFVKKRDGFLIIMIGGIIAWVVIILGLSFLNFPDTFPSIDSVSIYLLFIILVFMAYKDTISARIFLITITSTVQHSLMTISALITAAIPSEGNTLLLWTFIIEVLVFGSAFIIFRFLLNRYFYHKYRASYIHNYVIVVGLIMFLMIFVFYDYIRINGYLNVIARTFDLLLCIVSSALLVVELMRSMMVYDKSIFKVILEMDKKRYQALEQSMEQIKRKAHDLKYIEQAWGVNKEETNKDIFSNYPDYFDEILVSGNEAIDNIVTDKALYCKKNDITFTYIIDSKDTSLIDNADMMVLLGNLLDNAIECVVKYQEKEKHIITLNIATKLNHIVISLSNYCEDKIVFINGLPRTKKIDASNHGFGVKSIVYIVKKYHGTIKMETNNNQYFSYISIPIKKID